MKLDHFICDTYPGVALETSVIAAVQHGCSQWQQWVKVQNLVKAEEHWIVSHRAIIQGSKVTEYCCVCALLNSGRPKVINTGNVFLHVCAGLRVDQICKLLALSKSSAQAASCDWFCIWTWYHRPLPSTETHTNLRLTAVIKCRVFNVRETSEPRSSSRSHTHTWSRNTWPACVRSAPSTSHLCEMAHYQQTNQLALLSEHPLVIIRDSTGNPAPGTTALPPSWKQSTHL